MYKQQISSVLSLDVKTKRQFRGVYAMDRLPCNRRPGLYVINMDNHNEPGSHWVAVYVGSGDSIAAVAYHGAYRATRNAMADTMVGNTMVGNTMVGNATVGNGCHVEYFDSYGRAPSDPRLLHFLGSKYRYNSIVLQRPLSSSCGYYCLYFLLQRARGVSANEIVYTLSRTDSDFVVKHYVLTRYKYVFS